LQYDEDLNQIDLVAVYNHPHAVWAIESSPQDSSLAVTSGYSQSGTKGVTLWKLEPVQERSTTDEEQSSNPEPRDPISLGNMTTSQTNLVGSIKWHATKDNILMTDSATVSVWAAGGTKGPQVSNFELSHFSKLTPFSF
jgi:hypothetical protein